MLRILKTKLNYLVVIGAFALALLSAETVRAQNKKVKIFLLAGQSNTQGHGNQDDLKKLLCAKDEIHLPGDPESCYSGLATSEERLLETIIDFSSDNPKASTVASIIDGYNLDERLLFPYRPVQTVVFNYNSRRGNEVSTVGKWSGPLSVGYGYAKNGSSYGPELTFGHYMSDYFEEDIVLVKVAEGGSDLYEKWRSPSMEERLGVSELESNYPLLSQHLSEVIDDIGSFIPKYQGLDVDTELVGFVWFQGYNDGGSNATFAEAYEENLTDLITDLRTDLNIPDLPVVIGQTQRGGNGLIVEAAQAAVGNTLPNATSVYTRDLANYFHYNSAAYLVIGNRFGEAMQGLLGLEKVSETLPAAPSELIAEALPVLQVRLNWTNSANNAHGIYIERSISPDADFGVIAVVDPNTTGYTDWSVGHGTTYYYKIRALNKAGYSAYSQTVTATTDELLADLPQGWSHMDIGTPTLTGSTTYDAGGFSMRGQGYMGSASDNFHFAFTQLRGDGEIFARLKSAARAHWDNNGLMMRDSLNGDSKFVMTLVNGEKAIYQQSRQDESSKKTFIDQTGVPVWLKVVRKGDYFTSYSSKDGLSWEETARDTVVMGEKIYAGFASYSTKDNKITRSSWSNVSLIDLNDDPIQTLIPPSDLLAEATSSESITLSWSDNADNEIGFVIEQALDSVGIFEEILQVTENTTSIEIEDLSPGMTYTFRVKAYNNTQESVYSSSATATTDALLYLPDGWNSIYVGSAIYEGSVRYEDGIFNMTGRGYMLNKNDNFYYAFTQLRGDGEIFARLKSAARAHWDNNGLMMRDSLNDDSKFVMTLVNDDNAIYQQSRQDESSKKTFSRSTSVPVWLKVVRKGDYFTSYSSIDGLSWEKTARDTVVMRETIYVGLASYAPHANKITRSSWSDVSVNILEQDTALTAPSDLLAEATSSESIILNWSDNSDDEAGFVIEQALDSVGIFEEILQVTENATSIEIGALSPGTNYSYRVKAYSTNQESDYSNPATATTDELLADLPRGWSNMDIGTPSLAGSATYAAGVFSMRGQGYMRSASDNFHFAFTQLRGDGEIFARLKSAARAHWDNNGIMMRDSLSDDSKFVMTLVKEKAIYQQSRQDELSKKTFIDQTGIPVWLKVVRKGDYFTSYSSKDGISWEETARDTVVMGETIYVGLASYATKDNKKTFSHWSDVNVRLAASELASPSSLSAGVNIYNEVALQWVDNSLNETGFVIERSFENSENGSYVVVATLPANTTRYTETALTEGTYFYRIKAIKTGGNSFYSDEVEISVLEFENTVLHMSRLAGDQDLSKTSNTITVSTTDEFSTEEYMFTNMKGKSIDVALEQGIESIGSTISLKIVPEDLFQGSQIFQSSALSIHQVGDQISLTIADSVWVSPTLLDTISCNHIVVRLAGDTVQFYVNGEWTSHACAQTFEINELSMDSYNGQLWDIRLFNRLLTNDEVNKIGERCGMGTSNDSPYPLRPQYMCGSYTCFWAEEDLDMRKSKYLYHLWLMEYLFQKYVMEAKMYDHEKTLQEMVEIGRDQGIGGKLDSWIDWSFTKPINPNDGNVTYVFHELFHAYQFQGAPKWVSEGTANWAPSYVLNNSKRSIGGITLDPQWPLFHYNKTYNVPGGNRDYHAYIFYSFITRFVSDPSFIGRLYNSEALSNSNDFVSGIKEILEEDGHDLKDVVTEFAARTSVWDYEDGSGPRWEGNEAYSLRLWEERGYTDFNHKFANIHDANGTIGLMTAVPDTLRPYNYGWNAIKIDSTAEAEYLIRFTGNTENPEDTEFRIVVVKESGVNFEYFNIPVSDEMSLGNDVAQFSITTQADDKLYLIVVCTPNSVALNTDISKLKQYDYQYSIETIGDTNAAARAIDVISEDVKSSIENWMVYPIPTDGHLEVVLPSDDILVSNIEMVNLDGKQMPSQFKQKGNQITVDFNGHKGVYFLRVHTQDRVVTHKVWKQ